MHDKERKDLLFEYARLSADLMVEKKEDRRFLLNVDLIIIERKLGLTREQIINEAIPVASAHYHSP